MPTSGWWAHAVVAACVLAPAVSAAPYEDRQYQVVPYAGYAFMDENRRFLTGEDVPDDAYFGGRASARLSCAFLFELAGGFTSVSNSRDWNDWGHVSANFAWSPGYGNQVTPFLSVGGGWSRTSHSSGDPVDLGTLEGAAGFHVKITNEVGVRLEARDVYSVSPDHWNEIVVGAGLTFAFGEDRRCQPSPPPRTTFSSDEPVPAEPAEPTPSPAPSPEPAPIPPPLPREMVEKGSLTVREIHFAPGSADIEPSSEGTLQRLCRMFRSHPELRIEIGAHTDGSGDAHTNLALSERRAKAVYDWLVLNCLDVNIPRFTVRGYGEQRPVATNNTASGMAQNRRIEFRVLNPEVLRQQEQGDSP